jgi:hypothetical protein
MSSLEIGPLKRICRIPNTTIATPSSFIRQQSDRHPPFWSYPLSRAFAELLIECEEDRTLRAVLVGMLLERQILDLGPLEPGDDPGHQGCG